MNTLYGKVVLTIMCLTLLWIAVIIHRVESSLIEFRPIRSYYYHDNRVYDVAAVKTLTLLDERRDPVWKEP